LAAELFRKRTSSAVKYRATLYGSLAATGKGHLTDVALQDAFAPIPVEFLWKVDEELPMHPNGMIFEALDEKRSCLDRWQGYSIGGGAIAAEGEYADQKPLYKLTTMQDILRLCTQEGKTLWEFVEDNEGPQIWDYLANILQTMHESIERGLNTQGVLPGGLGLARHAWTIYRKIQMSGGQLKKEGFLPAYAMAVAEENAVGGLIVTAPTCGSAGVLPAVLRHIEDTLPTPESELLHALATAGLIGNLIKANASISGAEVGCQGEIGSACAMAAAAATQLMGGSIRQIEYAAEMGLEHHLGLTCDPVNGLVQIPCIERNAFAATRAIDCATFALYSDGSHRISFDEVVKVMARTGRDLPHVYRETAEGGLAIVYRYPPQK
jgi:L-serine dehydratase